MADVIKFLGAPSDRPFAKPEAGGTDSLGFRLEFAGRASGPAFSIVALGRDVRTIGNVPGTVICQVLNFQQTSRTVTSGSNLIHLH
jgi:hypothetical protein